MSMTVFINSTLDKESLHKDDFVKLSTEVVFDTEAYPLGDGTTVILNVVMVGHRVIGPLAVFRIDHPVGVYIDSTNWADFLYHFLNNPSTESASFEVEGGPKSKVSVLPSIGPYVFKVENDLGTIVIVAERSKGGQKPQMISPNVYVIKSPGDLKTNCEMTFNDLGIYFYTDDDTRYCAKFAEKLSPEQILEFSIDHLAVSDLAFCEAQEPKDLKLYRFEKFRYFKSLDGEVIVCPQGNPPVNAFTALDVLREKLLASNNAEKAYFIKTQIQKLAVQYVLWTKADFTSQDVMMKIITILEDSALWLSDSNT